MTRVYRETTKTAMMLKTILLLLSRAVNINYFVVKVELI